MNVVAYIGEPATGKTTIMLSLISTLREKEADEFEAQGLLKYHVFRKQKIIVFGVYDGSSFSGTDRLAKAAAPKFRDWIKENSQAGEFEGFTVYWEGERFTNAATLSTMFAFCKTKIFLLTAPQAVLKFRHSLRDRQSETWLKAMKTRIENIEKAFPVTVVKNA